MLQAGLPRGDAQTVQSLSAQAPLVQRTPPNTRRIDHLRAFRLLLMFEARLLSGPHGLPIAACTRCDPLPGSLTECHPLAFAHRLHLA